MTTYPLIKKIGLIAGPILFLVLINLPIVLVSEVADKVISVAIWMIVWWITEAVSISVTALIPLILFPLVGVLDLKTVSQSYGSPIVFLFFGGFVMALALEKVNLHKRIALSIIKITGTSPDRVILGFMIATAFMSMWISNTACTVVMLPIALSVIQLLVDDEDGFTKNDRNFALSIMLGIAFAANVGGVATIIGTPPNSVLVGFLENEYQIEISFLNWMLLALPFSVLMIGIIYFVIVKWIYPNRIESFAASKDVIDQELKKLGKVKKTERRVLTIFCVVIFLWISRTTINGFFPDLKLSDTGISMMGAFALFVIPFKLNKGEFTLIWKDTQKLPWGILILFGGGLALASGLSHAGLIELVANMIAANQGLSLLVVTLLLIVFMLFMTELMSNVALVAIFVPVVAGIAIGLDIPMLHLLIPVTMAASCAFMLPMATPPNAIVFASGYVKVSEMVKAGLVLNIISVILLVLLFKFYVSLLF
ncbi:DASS family sodium-coupled anion symporter [Aquimarina sp. BL5]|uniref:SLC13 family permease n=1 Tax=Aquimarina sp. BL5 TaxID=1714860 RepID=UPI000E504910|nr:DASS family sodium-coupled anion symporter [Aquimarina sp. BL5]AXT49883.1 DASS family sodium-coupled anion symporter [Aquimarina sp. BL5]RKN01806.1 DASS family sodium-coupled anion symporter [Aquimarina sp. BL5]